jgi:hypothetical protein
MLGFETITNINITFAVRNQGNFHLNESGHKLEYSEATMQKNVQGIVSQDGLRFKTPLVQSINVIKQPRGICPNPKCWNDL